MAGNTASYAFLLPVVGGDTNVWGGYLNSNWEDVDDLLDGTTPISTDPEFSGTPVFSGGMSVISEIDASAGTFLIPQGASVAPTAEGDLRWDTDDDQIKVGDGAATLTFSDDASLQSTFDDRYDVTADYEFDIWRVTADISGGGTLSGFERPDNATSAAQIGTGMSESSGVFTFPSTGKWLVTATVNGRNDANQSNSQRIEVSSDSGSNFDSVAYADSGNNDANNVRYQSVIQAFIDVTDAATFRVQIVCSNSGASSLIFGETTRNVTFVTFERLGDT